jgi:hypothetical protein
MMGDLNHPQPGLTGAEGRRVVLHNVLLLLLMLLLFCDRRDRDGLRLRHVCRVGHDWRPCGDRHDGRGRRSSHK